MIHSMKLRHSSRGAVQDLTDSSESDGMAELNGNIRPYLACGTEFAMWQLRPSLPPHLYKCGGKDGLDNLKVKTKRRQWKWCAK